MKIISKHKDYYDYLQGIYGIDEIMVYDRRVKEIVRMKDLLLDPEKEDPTQITFAICNQLVVFYYYKGVIYHTPKEMMKLYKLRNKDAKKRSNSYSRWSSRWYQWDDTIENAEKNYNKNNCATDINRFFRQPILIKVSLLGGEFILRDKHKKALSKWSLPLLDTFSMAKYIPADKMYQRVSAFIGWLKDHPEIPDKMTNKEKISSHGFDLKKSFRHRK